MTEQEIDLTYIISELQDVQGALEQGEEGAKAILERLEGIEARLKEVEGALAPVLQVGGYAAVFTQD